jgi:hypothetical protein
MVFQPVQPVEVLCLVLLHNMFMVFQLIYCCSLFGVVAITCVCCFGRLSCCCSTKRGRGLGTGYGSELAVGEGAGGQRGWGRADPVRVESGDNSFLLVRGQVESGSHIYFFSFSLRDRWRRDLYKRLASER